MTTSRLVYWRLKQRATIRTTLKVTRALVEVVVRGTIPSSAVGSSAADGAGTGARRLDTLEDAARQDHPPRIVMELEDVLPVDEVSRLKEESKEQLQEAMLEATRLRTQMTELTQEKQRLEQKLTNVHNY